MISTLGHSKSIHIKHVGFFLATCGLLLLLHVVRCLVTLY